MGLTCVKYSVLCTVFIIVNNVVIGKFYEDHKLFELRKETIPTYLDCPDKDTIAPCICLVNNLDDRTFLSMYCSNTILNETDLAQIFHTIYQSKHFGYLCISHNPKLTHLPNGIFSDLEFEEVDIVLNPGLTSVNDGVFGYSSQSLRILHLYNNNLENLTFESSLHFNILTELAVNYNQLKEIPRLNAPLLDSLYLYENPIKQILPEDIKGFTKLNQLWLNGMEIEDIDPDLKNMTLELSYNNITILDEQTYRKLVDNHVTIYLGGNFLSCDCSVSWIVLNPSYHPYLVDAECTDGHNVTQLNPDWYIHNCPQSINNRAPPVYRID
ncbi:unnamed protein product [Meganyctiphanes norvegica]|uniref:Uncharacterized protein n=1 Tax=Meganyctiphanes norvegica TaxID=48144 RepID=A0AAV2R0D0_MEGNR